MTTGTVIAMVIVAAGGDVGDRTAALREQVTSGAYVNLLNLNDSLLRYYQSVAERVLQEEHYQWWAEFGFKVEF